MKMRLEISVDVDDDVSAEDARVAANHAADSVSVALRPAKPVAHTWRLTELKANGGSSP